MPSDEAAAGDQGHVVEVVDVEGEIELGSAGTKVMVCLSDMAEGKRLAARPALSFQLALLWWHRDACGEK
jgi:hypothetical protein